MAFGNETCREVLERECPYCHEHLKVNVRSYANHLRHCKANPNYERYLISTRESLARTRKAKKLERCGEVKEFHVHCSKCGKELTIFEEEKLFPKKERYFCKPCSHSRVRTEESKARTRASIEKTQLERGLKIERVERVCLVCGKNFRVRVDSKRETCSASCSRKYRTRRSMKEKDLLVRYRKCCQFKFNLKILEPGSGQDLLKEFGMYKAANRGDNLRGVSRDHKLSIKEGYKQGIDPYYMSHPANCQLLQQQENEHKSSRSSITFEELKVMVEQWNGKYGKYENKVDYTLIPEMEFQK